MIGGSKKKGEEKEEGNEDGILPRTLKYIFQIAKEQVERERKREGESDRERERKRLREAEQEGEND